MKVGLAMLEEIANIKNGSIEIGTNDLLNDILETSTSMEADLHDRSIYFTGIGKNETIALKTANMFRSLQYAAHKICPVNAMHGDMGLIRKDDIVVALSKSGNTSELINFLQYIKKNKPSVTIYGIQIGTNQSKFDAVCDTVLNSFAATTIPLTVLLLIN